MTVMHHPTDDMLWAYAAGTLGEAAALVVATHASVCQECRDAIRKAEAFGGAMMEDTVPQTMSDGALANVMAKLDGLSPESAGAEIRYMPNVRPAAQSESAYPAALRGYMKDAGGDQGWKRLSRGVEQLPLQTRGGTGKACLLRIAPGFAVPQHGHKGSEITMVLEGGYSDDFGHFVVGDVEQADKDTIHRPMADDDGVCVVLTATEGGIFLPGLAGKFMDPFLPF